MDKTKWYTIDYQLVASLFEDESESLGEIKALDILNPSSMQNDVSIPEECL